MAMVADAAPLSALFLLNSMVTPFLRVAEGPFHD